MPKTTKGLLPSKNYRYQLYLYTDADGKRKYKSFTAESLSKAKKAADKWKDEHPSKPAKDPTFREAADRFLANRSATLSGSTYRDYEVRLDYICTLFPMFAKTRMSVIDSEVIQDIVNQLKRTKRLSKKKNPTKEYLDKLPYMSSKSVINYYTLICSVVRTQGGIRLHDINLPAIPQKELDIPEEEEIKKLLEVVKGSELEIPVLLAALGPMRRGEIFGLDIDKDIDFEEHSIRVHRDYIRVSGNYYEFKETPKSSAGNRTIIYPAYVTDLIKKKGHITTLRMDYLTKSFQRKMKDAGLQKYRFHDLRHYSASFQIALGIPPQYVMDRGGWETDYSMKRYIHALDKKRKEFADKTNTAFEDLLA